MSSFNGRRGPNVSQYLRELNAIPSQDAASAADEAFAMEEDLAMFTNTQFFDFDKGQNTDYNAPLSAAKSDVAADGQRAGDVTSSNSVMEDFASLDFLSGDFSLSEFGSAYTSPSIPNFSDALGSLSHIQPSHGPPSVYAPLAPQQHGYPAQPAIVSSRGEKRKSEASSSASPTSGRPGGAPVSFEEASRVAAEEDKRRRNTAASARFRVKKKQREQALEKSSKEMTDKVTMLEGRISQLETENKWLKNLIMEKNEGGAGDDAVRILKAGVDAKKRNDDASTKRGAKDSITVTTAGKTEA